jgi:hypothetical protein
MQVHFGFFKNTGPFWLGKISGMDGWMDVDLRLLLFCFDKD